MMRRRVLLSTGLLLVATAGFAQESTHEDQPAPADVEDLHGPFRAAFERALRREPLFSQPRELLEPLPTFFRDTQLTLKPRSYYFDRYNSDGPDSRAWTYGGSIAYQSGWLLDTFSMGAEVYTSQRILGREEDLTLLLEDDKGYTVLGQAYGEFRYAEQFLTVFRQRLDLPYVNSRDNRMTPNTFEAYTLRGAFLKQFQYGGGYVAKIKPRNEDQFISMSERAAGTGSEGLAMAGLLWTPFEGAHIGVIDHFVNDTLNIVYAESEYTCRLTEGIGLKLGLQFSDQRTVGDDWITGSGYDTRALGGQVALSFRNAILRLAFSTTDSEERIRSPWGTDPSYLSLMQRNFNRANEDAWLVGLSYDFTELGIEGMSAFVNYADGTGARDPDTGESVTNQREVDLTLDYRFVKEWVPGLWLRVRGSFLHREDDSELTQLRVILNYEFPVF